MAERSISSEFRDVDHAEKADYLVEYLEYVDSLPEIRLLKEQSYGYLGLGKGDTVLDAGCGPGYDALRMAHIVGKTGHVTGIDVSERMIAIARAKAKGTGLHVTFQTGDIRALDVPGATFGKVRIERTLQVLNNPGQVLDEMVRVLRPGGRLLCIEPDWGTFVCDPGDRDTTRTFFRFCADQFPDGSTGRKLYRYFRERGLSDVLVHPETLLLHDLSLAAKITNMEQFLSVAQERGVLPSDEVSAWLQELQAADVKGEFTFAGMIFAVEGKR